MAQHKTQTAKIREFLNLIRCSVGTRGGNMDGEAEDNAAEIEGFNILARKYGVRELG